MRTYVAPLGYDSTRVTRPVLSHGVDAGDRLVILWPNSNDGDDRAEEAITDVERMVAELQPDVNLTKRPITYDVFHTAVTEIGAEIGAAEGEVVVIFGGGARDVFLPLAIAAVLRRPEVDLFLQFSDMDGSVRQVSLPDLRSPLAESEVRTLAAVAGADDEISLAALSDELGTAKSTVTRHVHALEEDGLVSTEYRGKQKVVTATSDGELLLTAT